jgi:alkanesulfonate monooxygenase SsuD/methylene tetrahydromethanopterin reductase-like flavin-dependent oxidoreductase (luciferase family)
MTSAHGTGVPPFSAGSISLGLHLHSAPVSEALDELAAQAALAEDAGFDGVCLSEHHGGFDGYVPNPVVASNWLLGATQRSFVAAMPTILPLRAARILAEDVAWTAARYPGRLGLAVAPGYDQNDFSLVGVDHSARFQDFGRALDVCRTLLAGGGPGERDSAIRATRSRPVPLLSTASTPQAARRAASAGVGLLLDSFTDLGLVAQIINEYRSHGGRGATVLNRRVWVGEVPDESMTRLRRVYADAGQGQAWLDIARENTVISGSAADIAGKLTVAAEAAGVESLNLRVHLPAVQAPVARDQIALAGEAILPLVRARFRPVASVD